MFTQESLRGTGFEHLQRSISQTSGGLAYNHQALIKSFLLLFLFFVLKMEPDPWACQAGTLPWSNIYSQHVYVHVYIKALYYIQS